MSKSLGNVRSVRELLAHYPGEVLRFALLSAHYRSPLNFSSQLLDNARTALDSFYTALRLAGDVTPEAQDILASPVFSALLDDLNTAEAIAALHSLAKALNKAEPEARAAAKGALLAGGQILGLLQHDPEAWFQSPSADGLTASEIEGLITERHQAKANKDYARADAIRQQLGDANITLEDGPDGTTWRRA